MNQRFEKRLLKAKNPRMRKRNLKHALRFVRPSSHVDAFLGELAEDINNAPPDSPLLSQNPCAFGHQIGQAILAPLAVTEGFAIAAAQDTTDAVIRRISQKARAKALAKRRLYYAAEAAVRQAQRETIEQSRPAPAHPCPSADELTEAYTRRHESEDWKVRFGTLMIDLEEHVRRTYVHTGNKFSGSSGGVKDWLERECPLLTRHYSTCLRYKRMLQESPDPNSGT